MPLPATLKGKSKRQRLKYALNKFLERTHFQLGKEYNLIIQIEHSSQTRKRLKRTHPEFFRNPGNGLFRRDRRRVKTGHPDAPVDSLKTIHFKSRLLNDFVPSHRTALEDLKTADDFKEWFAAKFSGLPDGVYTATQRLGNGHGSCHLFLFRFEQGEIVDWKKKSNTQQNTGDGESSKYYGFPLFFYLRERYEAL